MFSCDYNNNRGALRKLDHGAPLSNYELFILISHVLNEQGTGYEHIFSSVQTFNID